VRVIASSRTTGSSSPLTRIALRAGNIVQNSSANAPSSGKYSRCGFFPEFHGCGRSHERGRSSRYEPWLTSGVFDLVARCFIIAVSIRINIRLMTLDQRLPLRKSAARSNAKQVLVGDFVGERFANLVTRESKCRRITVRPWHGRCSLSGDSNQGEYSSRGVPSKPWPSFARSRAMMSHAQV